MPSDDSKEVKPPTMLTFTDAAQQLVDDDIVRSMSAEGLRKIARADPEWPLEDTDYKHVAGVRLVPYEVVAEFMQTRSRRKGRGPDLKPRQRPARAVKRPSPLTDRQQRLLAAMRQGAGQWDATRAWTLYEERPADRKVVRRDLQAMCLAGYLVRVDPGVYELASDEG